MKFYWVLLMFVAYGIWHYNSEGNNNLNLFSFFDNSVRIMKCTGPNNFRRTIIYKPWNAQQYTYDSYREEYFPLKKTWTSSYLGNNSSSNSTFKTDLIYVGKDLKYQYEEKQLQRDGMYTGTYINRINIRINDAKNLGKTNFEGTFDQLSGLGGMFGRKKNSGIVKCELVKK